MDSNIVLSLIETHNLLNESVEDIVASLNTKSILRRDDEFKTIKTIIVRYGAEFATTALNGLKAAAANDSLLEAIHLSLCSSGISFSDALTQGMIDNLTAVGIWSSEVGENLKKIGIWYVSPVEAAFGLDAVLTESDVENALSVVGKRNLINQIASKYNSLVDGVENGTITTWEDAKAAFTNDP